MTYMVQKETFSEIITESLGEECTFETVKSVHESMNNYIEEHKEQVEPVVLKRTILKNA